MRPAYRTGHRLSPEAKAVTNKGGGGSSESLAGRLLIMKKIIVLLVALAPLLPLRAQLFTPESVTGAALGGLAGGIIGHNSGGYTGEGAAIGAGAGLLIGALVHARHRERAEPVYAPYPHGAYAPYYYPGVPYAPASPLPAAEPAAPTVAAAEQTVAPTPPRPAGPPPRQNAMAGANSLFGR